MHNFCHLTDEKTQASKAKPLVPLPSHRQPATQSEFEPKLVFSESTFFVDVMGQQVNLKGVECLSWGKNRGGSDGRDRPGNELREKAEQAGKK